MRRFGLIGFPLSHSFSKNYFTEKFSHLGLKDHVYELYQIENIDKLPEIIATHPDLVGLNVTIPYKQEVLKYLDKLMMPEGLSAANCIRINNGVLEGYNTDVVGFEKSFSSLLRPHHTRALVLGNGGATAAVVHVLKKLNIEYKVVSRQLHGLSSLTYYDVNEQVISENQVIINTTPVGTFPNVDRCPNIPYQFIGPNHYLYDLIYNPAKTLFLQKGEERGATIKNGYEMLEIQAEESWAIWNK